MLQCVRVCCNVLQCSSVLQCVAGWDVKGRILFFIQWMFCSPCVVVCFSISLLSCNQNRPYFHWCVAVCRSTSQCVAVCSSVLQCVAVRCSALQWVAGRRVLSFTSIVGTAWPVSYQSMFMLRTYVQNYLAWPESYRSIFMLRTYVQNYLAR